MSKLHEISPAEGSHRDPKRIGRGPGSGSGKTSGRGHKGQKSRSGGSIRRGFEGGQMPLQRRIPKRGFTPLSREEFQVVNLRDLAGVRESEITPELLAGYRLVRNAVNPVKLLGVGEAPRGLSITVDAVSASAREKVEAAGGSVTLRGGPEGPETEA